MEHCHLDGQRRSQSVSFRAQSRYCLAKKRRRTSANHVLFDIVRGAGISKKSVQVLLTKVDLAHSQLTAMCPLTQPDFQLVRQTT